jgi:5-deoxy-D-glucuronate isomerase
MKCNVGHEVKTETGFKVFEVGIDYPAEEIGDRGKYFEKGPSLTVYPTKEKAEEVSAKRVGKIKEEVAEK